MDNVIVNVTIKKELKEKALKEAKRQGFKSLQQVIRIFIAKLAQREIVQMFYKKTGSLRSPRVPKGNM